MASKRAGANIDVLVKENDRMQAGLSYIAEQSQLRSTAMWHGSNKSAESAIARRRDGAINQEMKLINDAVKTQRRVRLRDLYVLEQVQFEKELAAKGLSIIRFHE